MRSLHDALERSQKDGVAIGHFNVADGVLLKAVVAAGQELEVPVVVGVSEGEREFIGVRQIAALVWSVREDCDCPIFLNADHTHSLAKAVEAVRAGFDSIVFDLSTVAVNLAAGLAGFSAWKKGHNKEAVMSSTSARSETQIETPRARTVDMRLEIVVIPVSDVDRAKRFYGGLGWRLDADFAAGDDFRVIQFTPPGSGCSVIFGKNVTAAAPGSARGLYLIVSDIEAARAELLGRGVEISEAFHDGGAAHAGADEPYLFGRLRINGPDPQRSSYRSFASFSDPDGNGWLLQEITARLPGRVDAGDTTFTSSIELAAALRRAEAAHGEHEKRTGQRDANWADWYAEYIAREQAGKELPT